MSTDAQTFSASDPATGETIWTGPAAGVVEIDRVVSAARHAFESWADRPHAERAEFLESFGKQVQTRRADLINAISRSTGKPRWESATEVDALFNKVALTIRAYHDRRATVETKLADATSATRYKPHGVMAVFGPFNFPAHLPNGHILPALLAGNIVIFKPSEQTPLVGDIYAELWKAADLPPGVFNLVQGGRETGVLLANHRDIDGLLFTGSYEAGVALNRAVVDRPGKIVALEMGGNNPLIVANVADIEAAAYWTIQSAFITAGQRCSCARRLIVLDNAVIPRLVEMTRQIRVGKPADQPEPFMGPVISPQAAQRVLDAEQNLLRRGAKSLLPMRRLDNLALLSPGIIEVTDISRDDVEIFGPLLQVIRVHDFNEAIREANNTRYGLVAGLFSEDRALYETFYRRIRAGVINWNRPTTGASGALPFGGIGNSGNHRPSAYFAADYCSYPVAATESDTLKLPQTLTPGISLS